MLRVAIAFDRQAFKDHDSAAPFRKRRCRQIQIIH
jgi:hypothetical protein